MVDAEYHRNRKRERRNKYIKMLGGKCERCGSRDDLHFDHKNPDKKEFHISRMINAPEAVVIKEVKKCRLLCNDCHREKTRENWEFGAEESEHGTLWRYKKYKCRCDKCRKAMSDYYHSRTASADLVVKTAVDHPIREFEALMRFRVSKVTGLMKQMLDIVSVILKMDSDSRDDFLYDFFWRAIDASDIKSVNLVTKRVLEKIENEEKWIFEAIKEIPLHMAITTFKRIFDGSYIQDFKNLHQVMDGLTNGEYREQTAWVEQDRQLADAVLRLPALWAEVMYICTDTAKRLDTHSELLNKKPPTEDEEILYHATTNVSDLVSNGFRTEWEANQGLGGSTSIDKIDEKGVSFTTDLYVAKEIARCFKELIMIAKGEITRAQLLNWMDDKDRARVLKSMKEVHGNSTLDTPADVVNLYKVYLFLTKRYDPLFMPSSDKLVDIFSKLSPDNVGIIKAKVNMRHPGIAYFSGMHEYRVSPSAILSVEGVVG